MVKVIFINASKREITEVNLGASALKETYQLIGNDCSLVQTGAYCVGNDALMVDEEGYFKEGLEGFYIIGKGFFYGNAVIWGCDEEGDISDCETTIEEIASEMVWVDQSKCASIRESVINGKSMFFV